jgi:hypothetical protein
MQINMHHRETAVASLTGVGLSPSAPQNGARPIRDARDRILAGMVQAGLVQEAICSFLAITLGALRDQLVELDVPTPADRPMRRASGKNPWTVGDVQLLISLWIANIHPDAMSHQLKRSPNAIRAKARRIGLYRRERGALVKTIAPPAAPQETLKEDAKSIRSRGGKARRGPRIKWTKELDLEIARRWLAWQCRHGIARDLGLSESQVRTRATRMGLPPRTDSDSRKKIVSDYVKDRPYDRSLHLKGEIKWCVLGQMYYFAYRNGPRTCPKIMKTKAYKESRSGIGEAYLHL